MTNPTDAELDKWEAFYAQGGREYAAWRVGILIKALRASRAERDRLMAINAELLAALKDAERAIVLCAQRFDVQDECDSEDLCGNTACDQIGCLCYQRDQTRAAIAKAQGDQ